MSKEGKPGFDQRPATQVRGSTHALRLATDEQASQEEAEFGGPTEAISKADFEAIKAAGLDGAISSAMTHEDLSKDELEAALARAKAELAQLKDGEISSLTPVPEPTDEIEKNGPAATMMMGSVKEADLAPKGMPAAPPIRSHQAPPAPNAPQAPPVVAQQQIDTPPPMATPAPPAPAPPAPAPAPPAPPAPVPPPIAQPAPPPPAPAPPAPAPPAPAPPPGPPKAAPVAAPGDRGKPTNQLTLGAIQPLNPANERPEKKRNSDRDFFWWMVGLGVLVLGGCLGLLVFLLFKGPAGE